MSLPKKSTKEFGVRFWGVRGSLPSPKTPAMMRERIRESLVDFLASEHAPIGLSAGAASPQRTAAIDGFLDALPKWQSGGFGGDTSCVEAVAGDEFIVIDAGSGIRRLGEKLMAGPLGKGKGELHIFFTHFHWDHIIGLPFFTPIFIPGNKIHLHAVQDDLELCMRRLFTKPFFPVRFEELGAAIEFHRLEPRKTISLGKFEITPYQLDHPDPCWGYRVEVETANGRRAYAHCVDSEATRISPADLGPDVALYRDADLCFFDAQYTLHEFLDHMNWGHSAAPIGLEIALREGVKQMMFAHHDPAASDRKIADAERQTRDYLDSYRIAAKNAGRLLPDIEWQFARDGDYITIAPLK